MRSLLGIICVLSVFAATGYSLNCMKCLSTEICYVVTCPSNQVCASLLMNVSIPENDNSQIMLRTCAPLQECNVNGTLSFPESSKITFASSCCFKDFCTPITPKLPENGEETNEVTCPTCLSYGSDKCDALESVHCTGNENMCYTGTTTIPVSAGILNSVAARGCATKSLCDFAKTQMNILKTLTIGTNIRCTGGAFDLDPGFLLPAAIASALIQFMFFSKLK
ncbi:phospholipase A2 inhibitor and Ly6/PLAUR domain-containing protein [Xenopus laevis]|uniref:Phospholipase A2 inhibitor N-terminal domain-containing protein n=2 Tax=Xenopus laevis TaxID=8355 RepID=A0A974CI56_XENLA|nr:phospholipase A2 inhibitor and Ly6/PLAUR domain-containing protein [Xenopus laevis]OCT73603.1 hypothetical protein XELAEV_18036582mg [Xenopus laevis]